MKKVTKVHHRTYENYLMAFKSVIVNSQQKLTEANIRNELEDFIHRAKVSSTTINIYLHTIAVFLNWASDDDNNYIPKKNYIRKLKQQEVVKIKSPYTEEEYKLFLNYFANGEIPLELSQRLNIKQKLNYRKNAEMVLLLRFLWHTGARCSEILGIKIKDVDLQNNRIIIPNKLYKGEQEVLLLTQSAKEVIEKILENGNKTGEDKLFSWNVKDLPNKIMERAEIALQMKIEGRGLHGFRRAFVDKLFRSKMDIPEVKDIMRHRKIETTLNHYHTIYQDELVKKMNAKLVSAP